MTEEELEEYENKIVMQEKSKLQKEAENYLNQNCERWESDSLCVDDIAIENYIASAEPREKQIQIDAERIRALQKRNGELTDKVKELEAQIEKMKNWCNCKNYQKCLIELAEQGKGMYPSEYCCNCKKWEIKEKMTEQELYNEYRKSDCKSFTDFLINKIAELKKTYRKQRNKRIDELQKENAELKKQLEMSNKVYNDNLDYSHHIEEQLTKAKEYIKLLLMNCIGVYESTGKTIAEIQAEAEQFLKESE